MKIAILMAGHLRTWNACKNNFVNTLYDSEHDIDIFVDTYDQLFRTDYQVHSEQLFQKQLSEHEIYDMFNELNLVSLKSENEVLEIAPVSQGRKLLRVLDTFCEYESKYGPYDLVVKTRPDITLSHKVNYYNLLTECQQNVKTLFISRGGVNCLPLDNDLLAISISNIMKLYMNRFREFSDIVCTHKSLELMRNHYSLSVKNIIDVSIVRPKEIYK